MKRRIRWIASLSLAVLLLAAVVAYFYSQRIFLQPWQFLAQVETLEKAGIDETNVQGLGWSLAIVGRDDEVRQLNFHPRSKSRASTIAADDVKLAVVPWKSGIADIAAKNRIVMIMEDHFFSKHREFVGATLSTFKDAGFTHYAAEAIGQFDPGLSQRGYPNNRTGFYTSDPQFGNVLRGALNLDLTVLGYDFRFTKHEEREEYAAARLAKLFENDAKTKLLVHAGHSHVLKYKTTLGDRWLAALLWEKTGIEPFTIWQWSSKRDAPDYDKMVGLLKARGVSFDEPVLLMPPPAIDSGLQDAPYGLAKVDAIVLHPRDESVAPAKRTVLYPDSMQRLAGRWTANEWPVVVSAYKKGEPLNAIPLDQVMLRQSETDFVLWIPKNDKYEIRVFNSSGLRTPRVDSDRELISVGP